MNGMNPKVDWFFRKAEKWQEEFEKLRTIILDCGLSEELKWGCPCYTFEKRNIVLIHGFKEYLNNPKPGRQELKNVRRIFSMERD
jgi:uncharacterized protein YdeI (YjbR/CyaY-like superfamily)